MFFTLQFKKIALYDSLEARRTKSFIILGLFVLRVCILGLFVLWVCFGFCAERAKRAEPPRKRRGVVYCNFAKNALLKIIFQHIFNVHDGFYRFPKIVDQRKIWIKAIGRCDEPGKVSVICSKHFKDDDFRPTEKRLLKPGVVPSIFNGKQLIYLFDLKLYQILVIFLLQLS